MNRIYIWDNLINLDKIKNNSIHIAYIDPPYNTWNIFNYNDNQERKEWIIDIEKRIKKIKDKLVNNGIIIFSISEERLFDVYNILQNNCKYVFEPLIWQTKNLLNQNKVSNISSIIHEYILIASDSKIKSNPEQIVDDKLYKEKITNYPLSINLFDDISKYKFEIINNKKIYIIPENKYEIMNNVENNTSFRNHKFQKRTYQKWHGSERYINLVKWIKDYNSNNLYFIDWVKDKQNLWWKFILWNSYFQSISSEIYIKMPSFLGLYQWWIPWFQTAKPIDLMKRLFNNFNIYNLKDINIIDLYSWSGNVIKAGNQIEWVNIYWFEIGWIENKSINKLKENLKGLEIEYIE